MESIPNLLAVSHGMAKGYIQLLPTTPKLTLPTHGLGILEEEKARLKKAVESLKKQLSEDREKENLAPEIFDLLDAYSEILDDPSLEDDICTAMQTKNLNVEQAIDVVYEETASDMEALENEYFAQRASDIRNLKVQLLSELLGKARRRLNALPANTILVADDVTPAETAQINFDNVLGLVLEKGSKTAHISLIAQALKIPTLVGFKASEFSINNADFCLLDAQSGALILNPNDLSLQTFDQEFHLWKEREKKLLRWQKEPCKTKDGIEIELLANVGTIHDSLSALDQNVKKIGLLRTEFLYMHQNHAPSESQLTNQLTAFTENMSNSTIRLLDIGGDKEISYLNFPSEENPFLGLRGIRFLLQEKSILQTQIRSCLQVNQSQPVQIMIPMIVSVDEFLAVKEIVISERKALGITKKIPVGIMVETPASVIMISHFIEAGIDFISIGTNDLIQYTLSSDRGNSGVAYLYTHTQPAPLHLIKTCIEATKETQVSVSICGEMGGDTLLLPALVGMGMKKLSMNPTKANEVKEVLSLFTYQECQKIANHVLKLSTSQHIDQYLKSVKKNTL